MKVLFHTLLFLVLAVLAGSWGSTGHRIINGNASLSFDPQMSDFNTWTSFLSSHASDADYRKNDDPSESPKHYIDIDRYYSFLVLGRIPQTLDSVVTLYGSSVVYDNGILPYATIATVELLQRCFEDGNLDAAQVAAADLGHYVGDGHMPLHITSNYNGQNTGNDGIHSRYESSMISVYSDQIIYEGDSVHFIPDVTEYIFSYIYHNYSYIDSVLMADNYAKNLTGSTNSSAYKAALWEKTGGFTIKLMKNASHSLAELIYTAWVNAGSPDLGTFSIDDFYNSRKESIEGIYPTAPGSFVVKLNLPENVSLKLSVFDLSGHEVSVIENSSKSKGKHELLWTSPQLSKGMYVLVLKTGKTIETRKFLNIL